MISYLLTMSIYVPLILWWLTYSSMLTASPSDIKAREIALDLNSFQESVSEPIKKSTKHKSAEDDKVRQKIEAPKPAPKLKTTLEPMPKLATIPKVISKKVVKTRTTKRLSSKVKSQKAKKPKSKRRTQKQSRSKKRGKSTRKSNAVGKSHFINRLRSKIERNKKYPKIAQKRGMQGSVKVKFTITSSAKPSHITVKGSKVFVTATKSAIKRSFPISTKGVSLPMNITLTINYHLKK